MTIPPKYLDVLRLIHDRLEDGEVTWVLTGSLSFALYSLPVEPRDIDLQTDAAGAYEIETRFKEHITRPVEFLSTQRIRSFFGAFRLEGVEVEIMGDIQKRLPDGRWTPIPNLVVLRKYLSVTGLQIPVLNLAYEAKAYTQMGRMEKAKMLRTWLAKARPVSSPQTKEINQFEHDSAE